MKKKRDQTIFATIAYNQTQQHANQSNYCVNCFRYSVGLNEMFSIFLFQKSQSKINSSETDTCSCASKIIDAQNVIYQPKG